MPKEVYVNESEIIGFEMSFCDTSRLKGQITNYKPAIQITSISIKSDSIPLSGEFGHIVRVVGVPFLALNCDRCTADKSAVYIKCRLHKCLHLTIIMICI